MAGKIGDIYRDAGHQVMYQAPLDNNNNNNNDNNNNNNNNNNNKLYLSIFKNNINNGFT